MIQECSFNLSAPNAFSPNGDGNNDVWLPLITCYEEYTLSVFNRWGELVFNSNDPNEGWDGKNSESTHKPGVYLFIIQATDEEGERHNLSNLIHLTN